MKQDRYTFSGNIQIATKLILYYIANIDFLVQLKVHTRHFELHNITIIALLSEILKVLQMHLVTILLVIWI